TALRVTGACRPSADRRRVHDAALVPERIEASLQAQWRLRPKIALEHIAVIAHLLHDLIGPIGLEAEQLAHIVLLFYTEQAAYAGVRRALHLVDIGLADAVLLRFDHRVERPLHDGEEVRIAAAHRRAEWLLRNQLRKDDIVVRVLGVLGADRGETR